MYIIKGAEKLNNASANSILKFLEEPSEGIIAILTTENIHQVLGTIKSRCQLLSLVRVKDEEKNKNTKSLLATISFNNQEDIEFFINNADSETKINTVVEFIDFVEKNKNKAIIYKNKNFLEQFNDKKQLEIAFNWMILYYRDVLSYKLNNTLNYFYDYESNIQSLSMSLSMINLCHKIEVLVSLSEKIKFNVNNNMLMDKLVIKLVEG